ncbi:tyrosine-type recombinase/integrase [Kineococcus sp. R8]|uniref:tyrosine-type recombinase/integrase n=1 Tax=Kineococcus siccus TaxID=2696567 RepID=UPI001412E6BF|nr:tyrosine-type recombinase/integrase [Kineococcus siccus]NAZ83766.1 tyrosine-type recombinase/integrase [Kineococcus siccus]
MATQQPPRRPTPPLLTEHITRILATIDASSTHGQSLTEIRDRALVLLAFTSAMRASELAALDIDDLQAHTGGLIIRVRSPHPVQAHAKTFITIPWADHHELCPVHALETWLIRLRDQLADQDPTGSAAADDVAAADHFAALRADRRTDPKSRYMLEARRSLIAGMHGAVLRAILHNGRVGSTMVVDPHRARMARLAVTKTITARARTAELQAPDPTGRYYSAHSTRAGFAIQASANGASGRDIMRHGRWTSLEVAREYIGNAEPFQHSAASRLGL